MNTLIRPALYGAYHEIVNLTRLEEKSSGLFTIVGPICETGDRLGSDRMLHETEEGDVLLVANAGAYGYVMSSEYNLREPAPEVLILDCHTQLSLIICYVFFLTQRLYFLALGLEDVEQLKGGK